MSRSGTGRFEPTWWSGFSGSCKPSTYEAVFPGGRVCLCSIPCCCSGMVCFCFSIEGCAPSDVGIPGDGVAWLGFPVDDCDICIPVILSCCPSQTIIPDVKSSARLAKKNVSFILSSLLPVLHVGH